MSTLANGEAAAATETLMVQPSSDLGHNHLDGGHFAQSFAVFYQLRQEDTLTDITLKATDNGPGFNSSGVEARAHKLVLMAASEYFRTMFKSCYCESELSSIEMPGMFIFPLNLLHIIISNHSF